MHIRQATNNDLPKIKILVERILAEIDMSYEPETSEKDLHDLEYSYFQNGGVFYVLEDENKNIIGTIGLQNLETDQAILKKLYVDPDLRGKGYGKILTEKVIDFARGHSIKEIILETMFAMKAAIGLYEHLGFVSESDAQTLSPRCNMLMRLTL